MLPERRAGGAAGAGPRALRAAAPARSARGRSAPQRRRAMDRHAPARSRPGQAAEASRSEHGLRDGHAAPRPAAGRAHTRSARGAWALHERNRRLGVTGDHRMSDLPETVRIKEVGPREGFQFEKGGISLADKISLVDALSVTGVRTIEFTSFVSPKWVPQMSDAEQDRKSTRLNSSHEWISYA